MIFDRRNIEEIEGINTHDCYFTGITYDYEEKCVYFSFDDEYIVTSYSVKFCNTIHVSIQACELWGPTDRISSWYTRDTDSFMEQIKKDEYCGKEILDIPLDQFIGIEIGLISGDTIFMICEKIIIESKRKPMVPEYVLSELSCHNSEELQERAIQLVLSEKDFDYGLLFQPLEYHDYQSLKGNYAKILSCQSDEVLKPFLMRILEWIKDPEEPGAAVLFGRLCKMPKSLLEKPVLECIERARQSNDEKWLEQLNCLLQTE